MFKAKLGKDTLKAKNFEELFKELHDCYIFSNLSELQEILESLNVRLFIKVN